MKFKDWRIKEKKTQEQVAAELGVAQVNVCFWENGVRIPRPEAMQKILNYTNGEVQPNDFYTADSHA